jgi:hypothetical protein
MLTKSQSDTLFALDRMGYILTTETQAIVGLPLYIGEGRIVYAIAAYDTVECWQMLDDEVKQLDSVEPPVTLPALFSLLSIWAHLH